MCLAAAAPAAAAGGGLSFFQVASLAFSAGSTLLSFVGDNQAAEAAAAQQRYQAAVDRNNQIIANRQAEDALRRGEKEEKQHRLKIEQLKGRQKTVFAASGVETDSGSALDILSDTAEIGELEALTIRNNAEREAYGHRVQANNFGASAQNRLLAADNTTRAAGFSGFSTLLSGAGSVADQFYRYRKGF